MDRKSKRLLAIIARVSTAVIILVFLIWHVKTDEFIQSLERVSLLYLSLAVFCLYASILIGSLNQYILFQPSLNIPFKQFALYYFKAFTAGLLLPGQYGDASIVVFLKSKGLDYSHSFSIYLWDKFITLFFYLSIVLLFIIDFMGCSTFSLFIFLIMLAIITVLILYCILTFRYLKPIGRWTGRLINFIQNSISQMFRYAREYPIRLLINSILTCLKLFFVMLCYHAVLASLGYFLSVWKVGVSSITSGIIAYIPISIHGLGTVEATAIWVFGRLSVTPADVLSSFLLLRVSVYILAILVFSTICLVDERDVVQAKK